MSNRERFIPRVPALARKPGLHLVLSVEQIARIQDYLEKDDKEGCRTYMKETFGDIAKESGQDEDAIGRAVLQFLCKRAIKCHLLEQTDRR